MRTRHVGGVRYDKAPDPARLRELRQRAGLSQAAVAERLGVQRQAVNQWERGHVAPEDHRWHAIATLYGVPVAALAEPPRSVSPADAYWHGRYAEAHGMLRALADHMQRNLGDAIEPPTPPLAGPAAAAEAVSRSTGPGASSAPARRKA